MSSSTDAEKDARLRALVKTMHERVPKEKRLTVDVVLQLLKNKYSTIFPAEYLSQRGEFLGGLIHALYAGSSGSHDAPLNNGTKKPDAASDPDEDSDDDEEDDEDEEEGEEGEEDEEEDGEGDNHDAHDEGEEDDDDFDSEDDDEDDDDEEDEEEERGAETSGAEPAEKRRRLEGDAAMDLVPPSASAKETNGDAGQRARGMLECLRKLNYRTRRLEEGESMEVYVEQYLVPLFHEKGLDPARYSKSDVRRYRVLKEIEQLKADGADVNLDRNARAGRGVNGLPSGDTTINIKTSQFLDDDE